MTAPITKFSTAAQGVAAGSTPTYRGIFQDSSIPPQPVGSGSISVLTLSITDDATGAVVNDCDQVNILNTGRGTLDENGNLTITLETGDTAILRSSDRDESRSLTIDWEYPGPGASTMTGRRRVTLTIVAMPGD